jgi:hypothetical protein
VQVGFLLGQGLLFSALGPFRFPSKWVQEAFSPIKSKRVTDYCASIISISGVGPQGDPRTSTTFLSSDPACFIPPVVRTSDEYSILHNGISSQPLGCIKCLAKRRNLNSARDFTIFFCKFIVVYISPTITRQLNSHHQQSPMR